jgi:hypothetical protein
MKTKAKLAALMLLATLTPEAMAEGVASMTEVTAANGKTLAHHSLEVKCSSQHGKSFVELMVRPDGNTPFSACDVTIYNEDGKKIMAQFDPKIDKAPGKAGLPDGSRVFFHVADELIDHVQLRYHLRANETQSHVFTIKPGGLRGLSKAAP